MIDFIKQKLEIRKKDYLNDPLRILEDYRKEKEKIEEYDGRQLLEMLQNADDEAITKKDKTCFIRLTESQLTIANNGRRFSEGGIESLMYSNISPKVLEQNKVGQKGLGFRSILSWADKITIKSYDFAVEFSESNAKEFLNDLIEENPSIRSELHKKEKNVEHPIATLRCPKILKEIPQDLTLYDTYIVIDLKELPSNEVQEQISNEINKEVLLFLNNLEKIIIESPKRNFEIKKDVDGNKATIYEIDFDTGKKEDKVWNLKTRNGKHNDKNYELKIAWNDQLDDKIGRLYSYFKTNVKFPFPALIHGTFDLTSDRNHFTKKSEHNVFLIDELIQLIIDTALEISCAEVSYMPIKLLSIQGRENFDSFFDDNDFAELLKDKILENKIFPVISNQYISFENTPVFYRNNYAEILPKEKFPKIMLYNEDTEIIETVKWLKINQSIDKEHFFNSISEISNQLSIIQRAKLISYITKDYSDSDTARSALPNIFIDQDNQIIDSNSEIFLPPSGENIEIPIKLNLKIINSNLFKLLKNSFGSENAEVIEDRLKLFGIKVYRFGEIFRRIVSDHNSNSVSYKSKRDSVRGLLLNLYELYALNIDKEAIDINIPSNISIPILNRNNGVTKVNNVYLGKDYENKLCEVLYGYAKTKLVGSPKVLGLNGKENIIDFLKWLGVELLPRKKSIRAENDYGEFAVQNFPFKDKRIYWNDATLNSFKRLKQKGYWIRDIMVETIEDLDNLLSNNSNENILFWLHIDSRLTVPNETNSNSQLKIDISSKRYYSLIKNNDLPSYLLWKIRQINWIKTETDKIVKPTDCCISKTISKDFSPFIEIPQINYDNQLFKEQKISKDTIDYFLLKVGVNKEISDFRTDTIYSMLSDLKNIDKDGNKAKLIYRELSENLDDKKINPNAKEYISFINNGSVFCKKNGEFSYEPVTNVYYVEDKTFGEDIISQFYTIEIDRRKGAKKIKALFGVTPLENLEFVLNSNPILHKLNDLFQKEIDVLKPYFYAFRLSKDIDGKELTWIKNSKITLCTKIETSYKHNGEIKEFKLKPYEFIYIEKKNEVFLLVDDGNKFNSIADLQSDYRFPDSISEIYSSILKVDLHRGSFYRLFESNPGKRIYIIKTYLDDPNLEKLKSAKQKLNVVDDPKIQFWFSILSTLNKDYEYRKYKNDEFINLIQTTINININAFKLIYDDINDISNFPTLINLFKGLYFDISDFNNNSTVAINVIPYFEDQIHQLKSDYQLKFEALLYHQLEDKTIDEKGKYLDLRFYFETFNQFNLENTINVDVEKLFTDTISNAFHVDLSQDSETVDLTEIYQSNKKKLAVLIKPLDKNLLNVIIENNDTLRSLIYFAEYQNIIDNYNASVKETENKKEIRFNNKSIKTPKDDFEELYQLISNQNPITKLERINTSKPEDSEDDKNKGGHKKPSRNQISSIDKETLGFIGEVIVYESLKKKFGDDNVRWDSGYAKKANNNPNGDDNKHYDIKYKNNYGKWNYVEVKTTATDRLEFKISNPEVTFGTENKSNYELMIVINALDEKKNRRIKIIPNPFKFSRDESFTNNTKFLVKNDNFTIKLNEQE